MLIRFVRTVDSDAPGFPFRMGQIIDVPTLTERMRACLRDGSAVLLHDVPERAVVAAPERGITHRAARRLRRDEARA